MARWSSSIFSVVYRPSSAAADNATGELGEAGGALNLVRLGRQRLADARRCDRSAAIRPVAVGSRALAVTCHHVGAVGDPLQRLGPYRPWRREQEALAVAHVVVEQVDHAALAFDLLGD